MCWRLVQNGRPACLRRSSDDTTPATTQRQSSHISPYKKGESKPQWWIWSSLAHISNKASHWAEDAEGRLMWDESLICTHSVVLCRPPADSAQIMEIPPCVAQQQRTEHGLTLSEPIAKRSKCQPRFYIGSSCTALDLGFPAITGLTSPPRFLQFPQTVTRGNPPPHFKGGCGVAGPLRRLALCAKQGLERM